MSGSEIALVSLGERRMSLGDLPLVAFDKLSNCLRSQERLAAARRFGKPIQSILHLVVEANRYGTGVHDAERLRLVCYFVYMLSHQSSMRISAVPS